MIRERQVAESKVNPTPKNPTGIVPAGYRCTAKDENTGKQVVAFFAHTRSDEYRHAQFVETYRSMRNNKPYRSKALKEKARKEAVKENGTFTSDIGVLHHDDSKQKAA